MKKSQGFGRKLSRKDIIAFMLEHQEYLRNPPSESYPLAWNIKIHHYGWGLDDLTNGRVYEGQSLGMGNDERFDAMWQEKLNEEGDLIWDWAVEYALDGLVETGNMAWFEGHWDKDLDTYARDIKFTTTGKSGGWLALERAWSIDFTNMYSWEFEELLEQMDYDSLWVLYKIVVDIDRAVPDRYYHMACQYAAIRERYEENWRNDPEIMAMTELLTVGPIGDM